MLTHLRYAGYIFNPVSFYYCFDEQDESPEAVVAEITNTPWNERHSYVLDRTENSRRSGHTFKKAFHISPFMSMDHDYSWRLSDPGSRLSVHMVNRQRGKQVFDATLRLTRKPINGRSLAGVLCRYPLMTGQVVAGIYWQAWRLRSLGLPVYAHPGRGMAAESTSSLPLAGDAE